MAVSNNLEILLRYWLLELVQLCLAAYSQALPNLLDKLFIRKTLAVAGFSREQLEITLEENQLSIRGRQIDDKTRQFLHRGIAARQFQRSFLLADGMQVLGADLSNGLLAIDLARPEPERLVRRIDIMSRD